MFTNLSICGYNYNKRRIKMKFNAIQKYLLKVYAIVIIALTIFAPLANDSYMFGCILFNGFTAKINIGFLLVEYLAATLALIACILGTSDQKK